MPHIQSIRLEYGDEIRVLAVHFRDDKGDPVAYIQSAGYDFTLLPDGDEVAKLNGFWETPGLIIIDHDRAISSFFARCTNDSVLTQHGQVNVGLRANPVIICFVRP